MKKCILTGAFFVSCICYSAPTELSKQHLFALKIFEIKKTEDPQLRTLVKKHETTLQHKKLYNLFMEQYNEELARMRAVFKIATNTLSCESCSVKERFKAHNEYLSLPNQILYLELMLALKFKSLEPKWLEALLLLQPEESTKKLLKDLLE